MEPDEAWDVAEAQDGRNGVYLRLPDGQMVYFDHAHEAHTVARFAKEQDMKISEEEFERALAVTREPNVVVDIEVFTRFVLQRLGITIEPAPKVVWEFEIEGIVAPRRYRILSDGSIEYRQPATEWASIEPHPLEAAMAHKIVELMGSLERMEEEPF